MLFLVFCFGVLCVLHLVLGIKNGSLVWVGSGLRWVVCCFGVGSSRCERVSWCVVKTAE